MSTTTLERFVKAQSMDYDTALAEMRAGKKRTHWMWTEAQEYLRHPLLGPRLIEISSVLLQLDSNDPTTIFGNPDDLKLRSSMTLFAQLPQSDPVFASVLGKFFGGRTDEQTIRLIDRQRSG